MVVDQILNLAVGHRPDGLQHSAERLALFSQMSQAQHEPRVGFRQMLLLLRLQLHSLLQAQHVTASARGDMPAFWCTGWLGIQSICRQGISYCEGPPELECMQQRASEMWL